MASIEDRVKGIVIELLGVDEDKVVSAASFREELEADSLDLVELIMAFEEEFSVEIPDDAAEKIQTVKDAKNIHPGICCMFNKTGNNIVRVVGITHGIAPTEQHLKTNVGVVKLSNSVLQLLHSLVMLCLALVLFHMLVLSIKITERNCGKIHGVLIYWSARFL